MSDVIVSSTDLSKSYRDGNLTVDVLSNVDFSVSQGERIAIVGPSGSGKSTLLHLLGGLDNPSSGKVQVNGADWQAMTEKKRCQVRNNDFGFIYQFHHLLPEFSAQENVAMPLMLASYSTKIALEQAGDILNQVGLSARVKHKPAQLSGGERQRVAIARALVHRPKCILADEPTGNLDHLTANKIFDLMLTLNEEFNTALVIVTHDLSLASRLDNVVELSDGRLTL